LSLGQMGQWVFDRFVIASGKSHLFIFTLSSALQGLSKANPSMLLTMLRQAVLPLAFAYVVSYMRQINFIWFAFVIAEIIMIYPAINIWRNNLKRVFD